MPFRDLRKVSKLGFWVPYKIGGNDREMTPYGAVLSRAGRSERDSPCVLAANTVYSRVIEMQSLKNSQQFLDFERRAK